VRVDNNENSTSGYAGWRGKDLKSYFSRYGEFVATAAIDRYVYVAVNKMFENKIRPSYSKTEIVDSFQNIRHPLVREALRFFV